VGLNDRAANREAHPHAIGFGREQRIEYPIGVLRIDSHPGIGYGHHDLIVLTGFGLHEQVARLLLRGHRVDGVCDQVDEYLLQLNSVCSYVRQLPPRLRLNPYSVPLQIAVLQRQRFADDVVEIERCPVAAITPECRANGFDHRRRAMAVGDHTLQRYLDLFEIGSRAIKET